MIINPLIPLTTSNRELDVKILLGRSDLMNGLPLGGFFSFSFSAKNKREKSEKKQNENDGPLADEMKYNV